LFLLPVLPIYGIEYVNLPGVIDYSIQKMDMKKLLSILAITGIMTACGDSSNTSSEGHLDSTHLKGQGDTLNMGNTDSTGPGLGTGAEGINSGSTGSGSSSSESSSDKGGSGSSDHGASGTGSSEKVRAGGSGNRKDSL